ncbi:MAG TPA: hypothetical protein VHZ24_10405 [Pirellulales bacterium]|jgi:hypothetical protein|nr:hypothetical protein [Pirellulales bacterium]
MTIISPEIRRAIEAAQGLPVEVIDPQSQQVYVVVSAEMFEKLKHLVDDWSRRSMYPTMAKVMEMTGRTWTPTTLSP